MSHGDSGCVRRIFFYQSGPWLNCMLLYKQGWDQIPSWRSFLYLTNFQCQFGNQKKRNQWFEKWEDWAKIDPQININEWKDSLKVLASFNGLDYNLYSRRIEAYLKIIVSSVCKEIPIDIKWDKYEALYFDGLFFLEIFWFHSLIYLLWYYYKNKIYGAFCMFLKW